MNTLAWVTYSSDYCTTDILHASFCQASPATSWALTLGPPSPASSALTSVYVAVPRAGAEILILPGGETTMRRCRPGFAKSQPGGYRCVRCSPGSYASSSGSQHCRVCPYGTTSNVGRTGCGESVPLVDDVRQQSASCDSATAASGCAQTLTSVCTAALPLAHQAVLSFTN